MFNTLIPPSVPTKANPSLGIFFVLTFLATLAALCYLTHSYLQNSQYDRNKIEMSSGKNGKHVNQNAQKNAEEQYQKAKEAFDNLNKKPKKTSADNKLLDKLKKQVEHWRKKKDWGGENHSQKHKGN